MLFILNPETYQFALFIDAVGLEILLLLIEIQIVVIATDIYNQTIKPLALLLQPSYWKLRAYQLSTFSIIKEAAFMQVFVFSSAIGIVLNII